MRKKGFALVLCLALAVSLLPETVTAADGTIYVTCNLSGADIYADGAFSNSVTDASAPVPVPAVSAQSVSVRLPGYTAAYQYGADTVTAALTPELFPVEYSAEDKHTLLTVDGTALTLEAAAAAAAADTDDTWYVIGFADGVTEASASGVSDSLRQRGKITINGGDGGVRITSALNLYGASGVRLINLDFSRLEYQTQVTFRQPDNQRIRQPVYTARDIYILGCTFRNALELGIFSNVPYQCGGTEFGGDGTVNYYDIFFCNNSVTGGGLFNFAGAGDADYNVISGYSVCANRFDGGGPSFLAGDAHTWYVYGRDNPNGGYDEATGEHHLAFCDHNRVENIRISGNRIHNGTIGLLTSNLGNNHNLIQNVTVRNNRVTNDSVLSASGQNEAMHAQALSLNTVCVSDNYDEDGAQNMSAYKAFMTPGLTHTDHNVMKDIFVYDNFFACGNSRELDIYNVKAGFARQCGSDNLMENVQLYRNTIVSQCGVKISNFAGTHLSGACSGNEMRSIRFTGNTVTRSDQLYNDVGVTVAGALLSNHGQPAASYPEYAGCMSGIRVSDNTVEGFKYGVVVAGSAGDYGAGLGVSDVTVSENNITTALYHTYLEQDFGVVVAGNCLQTFGRLGEDYASAAPASGQLDPNPDGKSPPQPASVDCFARNVTVTGNTIHAQGGIMVAGDIYASVSRGDPTGNYVSGVTITGNAFHRRSPTVQGQAAADLPSLLVASALDPWNEVAREDADCYDPSVYFAGCFAENVTVSDNTAAGFSAPDVLLCGEAGGGGTPLGNSGMYVFDLGELGVHYDRAYYLPMEAQTHVTVKRTGLGRDVAAAAALYDANGRLLDVQLSGEWSELDTLTFSFSLDGIPEGASGKVFFLGDGLSPLRAVYPFLP